MMQGVSYSRLSACETTLYAPVEVISHSNSNLLCFIYDLAYETLPTSFDDFLPSGSTVVAIETFKLAARLR